MKIAVTKDFVIGVLLGAGGMAWMTAKKFGDLLRAEREAHDIPDEPEDDPVDKTDDDNLFFEM